MPGVVVKMTLTGKESFMDEHALKSYKIEDPELQKKIIEIYKASFESSDDECAQDQICYDEKSLCEALLDPEYVKFVVYSGGGVIGFFLLTNNLKKARITYCNDRYLRRKFPKYAFEGRLYYVTTISILPEMQSKGLGISLLESVCNFINDNKAMVVFDYSENAHPSLAGWVKFVGKRMNWNIIEIPLDRQCYTSLYGEHNGIPD